VFSKKNVIFFTVFEEVLEQFKAFLMTKIICHVTTKKHKGGQKWAKKCHVFYEWPLPIFFSNFAFSHSKTDFNYSNRAATDRVWDLLKLTVTKVYHKHESIMVLSARVQLNLTTICLLRPLLIFIVFIFLA
jgi:hypothetical protein